MLQPKAVEEFSFLEIKNRKVSRLKELVPDISSQLVNSDPAVALLEVSSYSEGLLRNRVNNGILSVTVQFATGTDLDNLANFYGIERKLIKEEDTSTSPITEAIWESDEDLRNRTLEAPKGFSVAGPRSSYIYYGKLADNKVKDISATSPSAGKVDITVLSYEEDGTANSDLIKKVKDKLNEDDIRPLGDLVNVQSAEIIKFEVNVELEFNSSPNIPIIIETVKNNIQEFVTEHHKLGRTLGVSGIYAACHSVLGVERAILNSPTEDIKTNFNEAPYCTNITVALYDKSKNGVKAE